MEYFLREEGEKYDKAIREEGQKIADGTTQTAKTLGKLGYAAGVEMLPPGPVSIGDVSIIGLGKDPYTGENTDRFDEMRDYLKGFGYVHGAGYAGKVVNPENIRPQSRVKNAVDYGQKINAVSDGYNKMEKGD